MAQTNNSEKKLKTGSLYQREGDGVTAQSYTFLEEDEQVGNVASPGKKMIRHDNAPLLKSS